MAEKSREKRARTFAAERLRAIEDLLAEVRGTNPSLLDASDRELAELLELQAERYRARMQGAPPPDSRRFHKMLEKIFGLVGPGTAMLPWVVALGLADILPLVPGAH